MLFRSALVRALVRIPRLGDGIERMRHHAVRSAQLAAAAGCSERVVRLIAGDVEPDDRAVVALRLADEARG